MKIKFYIISLVIFSLLLVGATQSDSSNSPSFFDLNEQAIIENGGFIENGVKVNYSSKENIEIEYERLLREISKKNIKDFQFSNNKIMYKGPDKSINIVLWEEENNIKVEITYINNDSSKTSLSLKKELEEIQNNNSTEERYYAFVKGKIEEYSYDKINKVLMNSIKEDTLKVIDIYNGYTATATFKDNQRINIGYMKYDSGRQIIIGTPVIFTTY